MLSNRSRDTKPEIQVRKLIHAAGLRYRVDYRLLPPLRSRADIVFTRARVAVFIDGCFWHRCPLHASTPKQNALYWGPKLDRNVERDRSTDIELATAGWVVLRFWEHEEAESVAQTVVNTVRAAPPVKSDL